MRKFLALSVQALALCMASSFTAPALAQRDKCLAHANAFCQRWQNRGYANFGACVADAMIPCTGEEVRPPDWQCWTTEDGLKTTCIAY